MRLRGSRATALFAKGRRTRGFALMLALVLMAFMLLLLVALGSLTQLELQNERVQHSAAVARANARLALLVALGELQTAAGPDRRVTTSGEFINDASRAHWAGVWHSDDGAFAGWLVSAGGQEQAAGEVTFLEGVYPDAADAALRVTVPKLALEGADAGGHYAYWIADEGVKAKLNVIDPSYDESPQSPQQQQRDRYRQLLPQSAGTALLFGAGSVQSGIDITDPVARAQLGRLHTLEQLGLLTADEDAQEPTLLNRQNLQHDVTLHTLGVLSSVRAGGLKKDLTTAFEQELPRPVEFYSTSSTDPVAVWWNRLSDFYNRAGSDEVELTLPSDDSGGYFPVPVKVNQYIALLRTQVADPIPSWAGTITQGDLIHVGLYVEFSLHNPYNVPLVLPAGLVVEVILPSDHAPGSAFSGSGARRIQVASAMDRAGVPRSTGDLEASFADAASGLSQFNVQFELPAKIEFEPGQTLIFSTQGLDGKHYDISAMADGVRLPILKPGIQRYAPGTSQSLTLPMVYKTIRIHEPVALDNGHVFEGLITAANGVNQSDYVQMRLNGAGDRLFAHLRFGAPTATGGVQWFTGFHNDLRGLTDFDFDYQNDLSIPPPRVRAASTIGEPTGGLVLSHEVIMPRRNDADGKGLRMLADYNMRAAPAGLAGDGLHHNDGYRRVVTHAQGMRDFQWYFHAVDFGSRNVRNTANDLAITGRNTAVGGVYYKTGWAGPSPQRLGRTTTSASLSDSYAVYFDVPQVAPFSLGALRHAGVLDDLYAPAYSVGTSYAPALRAAADGDGMHAFAADDERRAYLAQSDPLYRLNQALWDDFFFSSLTPAAALNWSEHTPLPNSRLLYRFVDREPSLAPLQGYHTAAAHLMVNGAFNVNSVSLVAWRSLLSGLRDTLVDYYEKTGLEGSTAYARESRQLLDKAVGEKRVYRTGDGLMEGTDIGTGARQHIWNGIRLLTDAEIDTLAQNIVRQLRAWGVASGRPFVSMAEFVNRHPSAFEGGSQLDVALGLKGILQYAIDEGPLANESAPDALERWENGINGDAVKNDRSSNADGLVGDSPAHVAYPEGLHAKEARSGDAPAFLSQGDLLSALAPLLTVRSDTFVIRAYGDAVNAADASGAPLARAWCEAVVQRVPEPVVRGSGNPGDAAYNEPAAATTDTLGRKFEIVSFRWLSEAER